MAAVIYLDTHVVAWLFAGRLDLLPVPVRERLDAEDLLVSPIVRLELEYLFEPKRTRQPARVVLDTLGHEVGLRVCDLPFPLVAEAAVRQGWTRDPFDRIIVGQAEARPAPLVSRDEEVRRHCRLAVWDA